MLNRRLLLLGLLATTAIGAATLIQHNKPTVSGTVRMGALLALTGSGANYGKALQQGIELAKDEINAEGGIDGKPLEVIYEDSQGDPKTGVAAFNKLVSINNAPVVLGSISGVVLATAPIANQQQTVLINTSAISPKICEQATDYLFSTMVSGAEEARFMASTFPKRHPNGSLAVLYVNNASGVGMKDTLLKEVSDQGINVVAAEGYESNSTDFRTQIAKIKSTGAPFGYLVGFSSAEFSRILRQSKEAGLPLQWYSYSGFETKESIELSGDAAEGLLYSYPTSPNAEVVERFQKAFRMKYGSSADIYTATSYDTVKMLKSAMAAVDHTGNAIRDRLRLTSYQGMFGERSFSKGKQCVETKLMWKIIKDGKPTAAQ